MKFTDLSANPRISRLMDLTSALRRSPTPYDALLEYTRYLGDAYPDRAQMIVSTRGLPPGQYRVWRLRTTDGIEHIETSDPWKFLHHPIRTGGAIAKIVAEHVPHLVSDISWNDDPYFADILSDYHGAIAVPLFNERLPLNWSFFLTQKSDRFTLTDLEDSVNRATLVGSFLDSLYYGRKLADAHAQIDSELQRMARIQRGLLPDPIPQIPGLDIAASYRTFIQVGGDIYDFVPLGTKNDRWCMFMGDASGHGPSAAVAAAMVQATLHACAAGSTGPAELSKTLNWHLCEKRIEGSFVTAFVGFYEPATRLLTYASAGHPPGMVWSAADQRAAFLDAAPSLPLGIDPDAGFTQATVRLAPEQTLMLYTDGISEARDPAGKMFGEEGIERSLRFSSPGAQLTIDHLQQSLTTHQQGARPVDDQTALIVRALP
jgi:sigma-B regulation protein RsbU (phosphoserine phosphatase)